MNPEKSKEIIYCMTLTFNFTAAMTTYHVHVITGTEFGSGTNANVFVKLYGDKDQTGIFFFLQIFIII